MLNHHAVVQRLRFSHPWRHQQRTCPAQSWLKNSKSRQSLPSWRFHPTSNPHPAASHRWRYHQTRNFRAAPSRGRKFRRVVGQWAYRRPRHLCRAVRPRKSQHAVSSRRRGEHLRDTMRLRTLPNQASMMSSMPLEQTQRRRLKMLRAVGRAADPGKRATQTGTHARSYRAAYHSCIVASCADASTGHTVGGT